MKSQNAAMGFTANPVASGVIGCVSRSHHRLLGEMITEEEGDEAVDGAEVNLQGMTSGRMGMWRTWKHPRGKMMK